MSVESSEFSIIYERESSEEPALVVQLKDLHDLEHPKIRKMVEGLGMSIELFGQLLRRELEPITTAEFPLFTEDGRKKEDIDQHIVNIPLGKIEVSDCKLYPPAVTGRDDTGLHLKVGEKGGFEVIYALKGRATLVFPERAEPAAPGLYVASEKRKEIEMVPGTLAIIPAPTANGWFEVGKGFEFRYISLPPWSETFVKQAADGRL